MCPTSMSVCLCDKLTLSISLHQTQERPERRKFREYVGWKLRQLVVIKIKPAERRNEGESASHSSASQLEGVCGCVCQCASCVCACRLSLMHLSVRACACIRAYIFLHMCGVCVRALRAPQHHTHTQRFIQTTYGSIIDVYVIHAGCVCMHI